MNTSTQERAIRSRADLITSILLVVVGAWIFKISYEMPRLEARQVHPSTIPGLVPIFLSAGLVICGALLAIRSLRTPAAGGWSGLLAVFRTQAAARVAVAMALVLVFTLGLVGWLPFGVAAGIFIFTFAVTFEVVLTDKPVSLMRSVVWAALTAIICGGGVHYLFTQIFLVRLP
jgi:uncharacterized protein with PQ loop repeat